MKSLYESILDNDEKLLDQANTLLLYKNIADVFHDIFGTTIPTTSEISKIGNWYTVGYLNDESVIADDFKATLKLTEKNCHKFFKELHKKYSKFDNIVIAEKFDKINITAIDKSKSFNITIKYKSVEMTIRITICGNLYIRDNDVKYAWIWTDNEELKKELLK